MNRIQVSDYEVRGSHGGVAETSNVLEYYAV